MSFPIQKSPLPWCLSVYYRMRTCTASRSRTVSPGFDEQRKKSDAGVLTARFHNPSSFLAGCLAASPVRFSSLEIHSPGPTMSNDVCSRLVIHLSRSGHLVLLELLTKWYTGTLSGDLPDTGRDLVAICKAALAATSTGSQDSGYR